MRSRSYIRKLRKFECKIPFEWSGVKCMWVYNLIMWCVWNHCFAYKWSHYGMHVILVFYLFDIRLVAYHLCQHTATFSLYSIYIRLKRVRVKNRENHKLKQNIRHFDYMTNFASADTWIFHFQRIPYKWLIALNIFQQAYGDFPQTQRENNWFKIGFY